VQFKESLSLPSGFREYYKEAAVNGTEVIISDIEISSDSAILTGDAINVSHMESDALDFQLKRIRSESRSHCCSWRLNPQDWLCQALCRLSTTFAAYQRKSGTPEEQATT